MIASCKVWTGPNRLGPRDLQSWRGRVPRVPLGGCALPDSGTSRCPGGGRAGANVRDAVEVSAGRRVVGRVSRSAKCLVVFDDVRRPTAPCRLTDGQTATTPGFHGRTDGRTDQLVPTAVAAALPDVSYTSSAVFMLLALTFGGFPSSPLPASPPLAPFRPP